MADLRLIDTPAVQREALSAGRFLRVLNWHHTPASEEQALRDELGRYLERFRPVGLSYLDRFTDTGDWGLDRPGFLVAFYDGYANHATVAARVCDDLGISAWFYPPTGFLDCPEEEQRAYSIEHRIHLESDFDDLADPGEGPLALTWDQLAAISERHVIAAHTANHASAADLATAEDVEREVTEPIRRITDVTGRPPASFAFLWGTPPLAGTPAGDAILRSGIRYATANTAYIRIAD